MEFQYKYKYDYSKFSDKQIVEKILGIPPNEEAAAYLLHDRYSPLLRKLYRCFTTDDTWFVDCVDELFISLKGKDCSWHALAAFEWRSTFGYWLRGVAFNKFRDLLPKLIENGGRNVSIDNDDPQKPSKHIPGGGEKDIERFLRKVMLIEAFWKLEDDDQRFVMMKRLEGYRSKEIAKLLKFKWKKHGIVKYNNENKIVVPDEDYVNVLAQRAKRALKRIMSN